MTARCPTTRAQHRSYEIAAVAACRLYRKDRAPEGMWIYNCDLCGKWHTNYGPREGGIPWERVQRIRRRVARNGITQRQGWTDKGIG